MARTIGTWAVLVLIAASIAAIVYVARNEALLWAVPATADALREMIRVAAQLVSRLPR
jgi:hypothetical protein